MSKKVVSKPTSPYDLGSKGGFKKQTNSYPSTPRTPYDLNRVAKRNNCSNGSGSLPKQW